MAMNCDEILERLAPFLPAAGVRTVGELLEVGRP